MHKCVVGLAYGDEGKGAVVDRLCATGDYSAVVRFNGGCQAAHNVITDEGLHHTFAQFGSGTLQGVPTYLSEFMMVEPFSLRNEAEGLYKLGIKRPLSMMTIHPKALITTPYHWLVNRAREDARGDSCHGSCGRGVGATAEYALFDSDRPLRMEDLKSRGLVIRKLVSLEEWAIEQVRDLWNKPDLEIQDIESIAYSYLLFYQDVKVSSDLPDGNLVFEGAQGVLLDEHVGFHPYTTWSTVTPDNVFTMVPRESVDVIGVTRTYMTRHGAGPFVTEDNSRDLPFELHNEFGTYQGDWRVGHLDIPALKYAIEACGGIDGLYVTHADVVTDEIKICFGYELDGVLRKLFKYDKDDLETREVQTQLIEKFQPLYSELPGSQTPDYLSTILDVPLVGYGTGPKTSEGVWMDRSPKQAYAVGEGLVSEDIFVKLDTSKVSRVEVVNKDGRVYGELNCSSVKLDFQDEGRTLKIFIDREL